MILAVRSTVSSDFRDVKDKTTSRLLRLYRGFRAACSRRSDRNDDCLQSETHQNVTPVGVSDAQKGQLAHFPLGF